MVVNTGKSTPDLVSSARKGILKNYTREKLVEAEVPQRIPVEEPIVVAERAYLCYPNDGKRPDKLNVEENNNASLSSSDNTPRDFLIQKRSSLTHTPDIARVFGQNSQKLSSTEESLHEFQKVKLRHVENTAGGILSPEVLRKFEEKRKSSKDIIVDLTPAPVKLPTEFRKTLADNVEPRSLGTKATSGTDKTVVERSRSFTKIIESKNKRNLSSNSLMSASMYSSSDAEPLKKASIKRESSNSSMALAKEEKYIVKKESNKDEKKSPRSPLAVANREDKNIERKRRKEPTLKEKNAKKPTDKVPISPKNDHKPPITAQDKTEKKNSEKVSPNRKSSPLSKTPSTKNIKRPEFSQNKRSSTEDKKNITPEFKRKSEEEKKSFKKEAPSPSIRRRTLPSPTLKRAETKKKSPTKISSKKRSPEPQKSSEENDSAKKSDESKRPERVSGLFKPTQAWLSHMGDKVDVKSRTPSPGVRKSSATTPTLPRKRSEDCKSSAPIRRTESFDKKKSVNEEVFLRRSSSLRSNPGKEAPGSESEKRSKKIAPPTLPKPNKNTVVSSYESAPQPDSCIEETSVKASTVIQKFEAVKGNVGKASLTGSPNITTPSFESSAPEIKPLSKPVSKFEKFSSKLGGTQNQSKDLSDLSPTMVTGEEYLSRRSSSTSRTASMINGDLGGSQSAEKYKTTMVVRLHPGQSRKLSNCSTTMADSQSSIAELRSSSRERMSISGSTTTSSMMTASGETRRYSADIHDTECENTDSNSCCASGLEITFESAPQTIDIKLIPSPTVEERGGKPGDDEEGNRISQEQIDEQNRSIGVDKTRQ